MDYSAKSPLFKKIDTGVFGAIDKFKTTPNYQPIQDFYNGLDEDQQKWFKLSVVTSLFAIPLLLVGFLWMQNSTLRTDLELRLNSVEKINEILAQNRAVADASPMILSQNPIDSQSMMTSRLGQVLSGGFDLSKIQVTNFNSTAISSNVYKAEADFRFNSLSTDQMVNMMTSLMQREKFRIESLKVQRNAETNLLDGEFHAVHFSVSSSAIEED
jgi:hypothetical protein